MELLKNDCFTCNERNGNTTNPKYDILQDDCISYYEYDSENPYWDGEKCISCELSNHETPVWNGSSCISCYDNSTPAWSVEGCTVCPEGGSYDLENATCICPEKEGCAYNVYDRYENK